MKKILQIIAVLFLFKCSAKPAKIDSLQELHLQTLDGKDFSLKILKNFKATAIVFLLPDCPACQGYSKSLNELSQRYLNKGIQLIGIFPGEYNTSAEMVSFQSDYKIQFTLLKDPGKKSVRILGARIAPEVVVVNSSSQIMYRGRIDDWMVALGKKRTRITHHDLESALESICSDKPILQKETIAIGCIIE